MKYHCKYLKCAYEILIKSVTSFIYLMMCKKCD